MPGDFYPIVLILGFTSGLAGIAIMRGVTLIEAGFRRSFIPIWLRPVFGGAVVGLLGCIVPSAMSSGHSALHADIDLTYPFLVVLEMLVFKAVASAFSIGAGFRGGLFFASLFLGALFGKVFAGIVSILPFVTPMPTGLYAVIGMSALAVSIVGGPMTMTFLALESTQNFAVTMAVLAASITATLTVRRLFGYSFATWRFHLRGEPIRSAVDIGWIKSLTVERMMNPVQHKVAQDIKLEAFRQDFPLSAAQFVIVLDAEQKIRRHRLSGGGFWPCRGWRRTGGDPAPSPALSFAENDGEGSGRRFRGGGGGCPGGAGRCQLALRDGGADGAGDAAPV